jgi:superfamily I DNA/RNA helicase
MGATDKYDDVQAKRQEHTEAILKSDAPRKVVVAGPGTGKTHLFKQVVTGKPKTLTLSFINALVEDLSLELAGLSEVKTLHGFARGILKTATRKDVAIYPRMSKLMAGDAKILLGRVVDFDTIFHTRDDDHADLEFYRNRRRYYGHYGYSDVVFSAVTYLEKHREKVPGYDHVVVDEFQDFNLLEVSLINLLAERSPLLIAGDDDQALYDFKKATPQHIRDCHASKDIEFAAFNLPFCSRCTEVIVKATNDVIAAAKKRGLLVGRIDKPYVYFDDPKKDADGKLHPAITYRTGHAAQMPWAIEQEIGAMAEKSRGPFSVLVIAPLGKQCQTIAQALRAKGFSNVTYVEREGDEPTLLDGLKLLLEDKDSNLGWRIVAGCLLAPDAFAALLSSSDTSKPFADFLDKDFKKRVRVLLTRLRAVKSGSIGDDALQELLTELSIDPFQQAKSELAEDLKDDHRRVDAAIRKIPIRVTTVQSSKGLADDLVVIANFDDQYFIHDKDKTNISDLDVCNVVVAMTRARKKLVFISSPSKEPTVLSWIDASRIERP